MEQVQIGYIIGSFKVDGEVKVNITTDFFDERYKINSPITVKQYNETKELILEDIYKSGQFVIAKFKEINSKEEADALKGAVLLAEKDASLLKKDEYYFSDLIGCKVINQEGTEIGIVKQVEEYPAQLTLRVKGNSKDILIPFVKAFIKQVNIKEKTINVETIEGMI